ncbi:MAG: hypothetical protein COA32_03285 [Fluviicola sp.]|nr:MAG: hypothetical protein COA32_03285 [Fluviicola sp.]
MNKRIIASLDHRYSSRSLGAIILLTLGVIGITTLSIVASVNNFDVSKVFNNPLHFEVLPYFIPSLMVGAFLFIGLIVLLFHFKKQKAINTLLKKGKRAEASIISSIQDFSVTTNNVPRRIIKFKIKSGQIFTFKAFDYGLVPHLTENKVVPIYYNEKGDMFPDPNHFNDLLKEDITHTNTSSFESQFAEKCLSQGDEHFKNENFGGALMAYEMAYEKETSEKVIRKIAEAHEKLGNSEEAKAFLRKLD